MKKNEIILIYPKTGLDTDNTTSIPLSLLFISAKIAGNPSFSISIIDQRIDKSWKERLKNQLTSGRVLCVGISTMTGTQIRFALRAAEHVRRFNPIVPIVWGGIHPTLNPEETIIDSLVDIVVIGEAEDTFPELVQALYDKRTLDDIPGIVFKDDSGIPIKTKVRGYADINQLPDIPYHLINMKKYFYNIVGEKALPMLFSRGCPHRCTFCYRSNNPPPKWRPVSLDRIRKELKTLMSLGAKTIIPLDDNFFVDKERIIQICAMLKQHNIHLKFHVNCRIDYADKMKIDDLIFLRDSGFASWDFGIESGSQKTLDFMNKDITIDQVYRVNLKLKKVGIIPTYSFMGGFLHETYEDLEKTLDIMFKLISDYPEAYLSPIKIFTPFPNTAMIDSLPHEYYARPKSLRDWANYDYNTPHIVWHSKKDTRLLEKISFYSYFIDGKRIRMVFGKNILLRSFLSLYSDLARLRLKKGLYFLPVDYLLMRAFYKAKKLL
jgi:anaerobic magnesium-protoporphyrin IX monomethyl ester cyclase